MKTMITAHAGAEKTVPNSLESITYLAGIGADAMEVDVRLRDGQLILTHNPPEAGQICTTLAECYAVIAAHEGLLLNLDVKEAGLVRPATELAERCGVRDQIMFTGDIGPEDMDYIRVSGVTAWFNESLLNEKQSLDPFVHLEEKGFQVLNTFYMLAWPDRIERFGAEHFSVWTPNEEENLIRFLRAGVRNITTRSPLKALALRDSLNEKA